MIANVMLKSRADIENLNRIASRQNYEMSVSCGSVMIDAKSLLALFVLMGRKVSVVAPDDVNPKAFSKLVKEMNLTEA